MVWDDSLTLTSVAGLLVGQATDEVNRTGCTAIICPEGTVASVHVPGFAPGTRETDLLRPEARVEEVHGLLLSGGSAFGLAAASGVVRRLREEGRGLVTPYGRIPLVPAAVIYDLNFNQTLGQPDEAMGYAAARAASAGPVAQGNVGAGTGATAGKLSGFDRAMKTGLGSAGQRLGEIIVAALAVANPMGYVVDPETARPLAGPRDLGTGDLIEMEEALTALIHPIAAASSTNTCLGVVATNARLTKLQAARLARMASAGFARALRPAHLMYDGDVVFSLATGQGPAVDENLVGIMGAEVLGRAVANAARAAKSVPGYPAWRDLARQ